MNVVHIVTSLSSKGGGIAAAVWALAKTQRIFGLAPHVVTLEESMSHSDPSEQNEVSYYLASGRSFGKLHLSLDLHRHLLSRVQMTDVVHSHTVWQWPGVEARWASERYSKVLIVSTHGMLEPWCLMKSRLKKRMMRYLYADMNVRSARCIHATAQQEAENLRRLGFKNPIAVLPIGVDTAEYAVPGNRPCLDTQWPELSGKHILLFLSRIEPKKGLSHLSIAWAELIRKHRDWHLVIAGPDEKGHMQEVCALIESHGVLSHTTFAGPVYGDLKKELFAACDVFVLPTFSENFGIVVAEALASGKPVITTKGTPWREIQTHDCGWYIDIGVEPLYVAMREAMDTSDLRRREMGLRGRALIEKNYSWPKIAVQMIDVYKWCLGQADKPDCVRLD